MKPDNLSTARKSLLSIVLCSCVLLLFVLATGALFLTAYFLLDGSLASTRFFGWGLANAALVIALTFGMLAAFFSIFIYALIRIRRRLEERPAESATDQVICAECKNVFNTRDMIAHSGVYFCASCKPVFLQKLAEGLNPPTSVPKFRMGLWVLLAIVAALAIALAVLLPPLPSHHRPH